MTTMTMNARARRTDLESSHEAAASVKVGPNALTLLNAFAKKSMTAESANYHVSLYGIPGYWKRVSDLRNLGLIEQRGARAGKPMWELNLSGRKAAVWIITPMGRAVLRNNKNVSN